MSATGSGTPYLLVPTGDGRPQPSNLATDGPIIKYKQKGGEKTCMSLALANALHFLGEKQLAHGVFSRAKRCEKRAWGFRRFCSDLRDKHKHFNKITFPPPQTTNILDDLSQLQLVCILGSDGKQDHCVAFTHEWIFDANFDRALPRSITSLNMCCSSIEVSTKYVGAVSIAVFPKIITT